MPRRRRQGTSPRRCRPRAEKVPPGPDRGVRIVRGCGHQVGAAQLLACPLHRLSERRRATRPSEASRWAATFGVGLAEELHRRPAKAPADRSSAKFDDPVVDLTARAVLTEVRMRVMSLGAPWVAQRAWLIPTVVSGKGTLPAPSRLASLPARLRDHAPLPVSPPPHPRSHIPRYSSRRRTLHDHMCRVLAPTYPRFRTCTQRYSPASAQGDPAPTLERI